MVAPSHSDISSGVTALHERARLAQQRLAFAVVAIPTLGALAALALLFVGVRPTAVDLTLFVVMFVATTLGIELGFHRHFTHAAFKAHPALRTVLAVLGSMASQGPLVFWAATHRRHHAYSDSPGDPHSPYLAGQGRLSVRGLWHAHVGWLFRQEMTDWGRYVPDLVRDRRLLAVNQSYSLWVIAGLIIPALIGGLVTQSLRGALSAALWGGLVRTFVLHHATWSVNSICHVLGARPYPTRGRSTNNVWLALPTLGGAWHNNHHANPSLAKNNVFPWQVDGCGAFLTLAEKLGLAWDAHVPTERMRRAALGAQLSEGEAHADCDSTSPRSSPVPPNSRRPSPSFEKTSERVRTDGGSDVR